MVECNSKRCQRLIECNGDKRNRGRRSRVCREVTGAIAWITRASRRGKTNELSGDMGWIGNKRHSAYCKRNLIYGPDIYVNRIAEVSEVLRRDNWRDCGTERSGHEAVKRDQRSHY